jgi:hypothetical protein
MGRAFFLLEIWGPGIGVVLRAPSLRRDFAGYRDPSTAWDGLSGDPTPLKMTNSKWGEVVAKCKGFKTFKERGEWVELQFMARAVRLGFKVSKPWGDSSAYDVGIESGERILRVQVKSTDCRTQYGYLCQFKPNAHSKPYTLKQVDFFAAYVIPEDVWYLIPAAVLLRGKQKKAFTLLPEKPLHPERYKCEGYREAWRLLLPGEVKSKTQGRAGAAETKPGKAAEGRGGFRG